MKSLGCWKTLFFLWLMSFEFHVLSKEGKKPTKRRSTSARCSGHMLRFFEHPSILMLCIHPLNLYIFTQQSRTTDFSQVNDTRLFATAFCVPISLPFNLNQHVWFEKNVGTRFIDMKKTLDLFDERLYLVQRCEPFSFFFTCFQNCPFLKF